MEFLLEFYGLICSNNLYMGISIYVLGILFQSIISILFIQKRKRILIQDYGFNRKRLRRLWILSSVLFPVAWYYGLKSIWMRLTFRSRVQRKLNKVDEDIDY